MFSGMVSWHHRCGFNYLQPTCKKGPSILPDGGSPEKCKSLCECSHTPLRPDLALWFRCPISSKGRRTKKSGLLSFTADVSDYCLLKGLSTRTLCTLLLWKVIRWDTPLFSACRSGSSDPLTCIFSSIFSSIWIITSSFYVFRFWGILAPSLDSQITRLGEVIGLSKRSPYNTVQQQWAVNDSLPQPELL